MLFVLVLPALFVSAYLSVTFMHGLVGGVASRKPILRGQNVYSGHFAFWGDSSHPAHQSQSYYAVYVIVIGVVVDDVDLFVCVLRCFFFFLGCSVVVFLRFSALRIDSTCTAFRGTSFFWVCVVFWSVDICSFRICVVLK